jgi:trans-2,3-dihydro-3-hydroxyanthranilate isomerase
VQFEDEVAALKPDFATLKGLGVAANCFAGSGRSWKTRMFFPAGSGTSGSRSSDARLSPLTLARA